MYQEHKQHLPLPGLLEGLVQLRLFQLHSCFAYYYRVRGLYRTGTVHLLVILLRTFRKYLKRFCESLPGFLTNFVYSNYIVALHITIA